MFDSSSIDEKYIYMGTRICLSENCLLLRYWGSIIEVEAGALVSHRMDPFSCRDKACMSVKARLVF